MIPGARPPLKNVPGDFLFVLLEVRSGWYDDPHMVDLHQSAPVLDKSLHTDLFCDNSEYSKKKTEWLFLMSLSLMLPSMLKP